MVKTLYSILHRSLDLTEFMEEVLIDDNMVFDIDNLKELYNINLIEKAIENRVNLNKISIESKKQFIKLDKFIK